MGYTNNSNNSIKSGERCCAGLNDEKRFTGRFGRVYCLGGLRMTFTDQTGDLLTKSGTRRIKCMKKVYEETDLSSSLPTTLGGVSVMCACIKSSNVSF